MCAICEGIYQEYERCNSGTVKQKNASGCKNLFKKDMNIYDFLLNSKSLELKNDTLHKR